MENLLHDIVNHNLQNRTVALIENGSWAPAAGGLMHDLLAQLPGTKFIDQTVTVRSSLKERQMCEIDAMVQAIAATMPGVCAAQAKKPDARAILRTSPAEMAAAGGVEAVDPNAMLDVYKRQRQRRRHAGQRKLTSAFRRDMSCAPAGFFI